MMFYVEPWDSPPSRPTICENMFVTFPSILHKSKFGDVKFRPNKWRTSWLLENGLEPRPCQIVFSAIVFFGGVFFGAAHTFA